MPIYRYERTDNGQLVELDMTIAEMERREKPAGQIMVDGVKCLRLYGAQAMARKWSRGHRSNAMGLASPTKAQAHEETEFLRKATGYKEPYMDPKSGQVVTFSEKQKVACAKAYGYCDLDGGYTS